MASIQESLEAALDNVAPDGDSWVAGRDEFWRALSEDYASLNSALNAALKKANGDRRLPDSWHRATLGRFWRTKNSRDGFSEDSIQETEERPNDEPEGVEEKPSEETTE